MVEGCGREKKSDWASAVMGDGLVMGDGQKR
jgi:hypothetical protein